jgi:uncharacterized protein (TIGR02246 family)
MASGREELQRSKRFLWGCGALILIVSGCGRQTPPDTRTADESSLRSLDVQWSKTAAAQDVDGTVSYYSDDASLLPPNAPIATGRQAIRAVWAALLGPDVAMSWQPSTVEVARSSDLAYLMGVYQMTLKDSQGKPVADHGKFVEVWKKQADGKWKVVADIFNSDLPVAAPAVAKKKTAHPRSSKKHHTGPRSGRS